MSVWEDCLEILKNDSSVRPTMLNIILKNIKQVSYEENKYIILSCRDEYCIKYVKSNSAGIKDLISSVVNLVCGANINIQFVLENDTQSLETTQYASEMVAMKNNQLKKNNSSLYFNPNSLNDKTKTFTFDNFIAGESNRFAKANAMQVAENPGYIDINPLYIWGNSGLGKTHLLYAIADKIYENNPNMNIIYTECETFINDYVMCTKNNSYDTFRSRFSNADVLLIDDIQYLIGKIGCQNEFFSTFNNLIKAGKQIVISSDKSPNFMPDLDERLTSRFSQGVTMDIQPPNYETRKAILLSKCEADNITLDDTFINYFCENFTTNIRTLLGAYTTFKSYLNISHSPIDFETFETIMKPLVTPNKDETLSPDFIANKVCNYYSTNYSKVTIDKLKSDSRAKDITEPRNICIYFFIELLHMTYNDIGMYFGGRKHSTIKHSYDLINDKLKNGNKDITSIINSISKEFN